MANVSITQGTTNDITVLVNSTDVVVTQANNVNVEVTPTPTQVINIDRNIVGLSGYSGYSGFSGSGISGFSGFSGYSGSGISGYSGFSGSGISGYSGFSGYSGSGISGFSGYSGYSGSGISGWSGFSGISGFSGFSGYSGSGISGYSGFSGSGISGWSGFSGYSGSGISGFSGYSGSGISGFSGYSGFSGSGISGWSGYSGSGISGFSGYSGYSGSGISGWSGFSGTSGFSGFSGYSGVAGAGGSIGWYGLFISTSNQANGGSTTANVVSLDSTAVMSNGISVNGGNSIKFSNAGKYKIITELATSISVGANPVISVWLAQNGTNIANTAQDIQFVGGSGNVQMMVCAWIIDVAVNDTIQVYWSCSNTNASLAYQAALTNPTRPASPSAVVNVSQIAYSTSGYSGYSGFSGSGISGFSGFSGYSGSGISGYSGYSGSGISGYSGFSGSGLSGYSGFSGYSGSGISGYSGFSGYSGATPAIGGTNTQLQYNNSGVLGGVSQLTYNGTTLARTGGTIDGTTIGGTTPAAGTFTTLTGNSTSQFGRSSANYIQAVGAATTLEPVLSVLGSDTNIPLAIQTKGTGAIDLAAGSSGVNISNGGTVTAITRTSPGGSYTSAPTPVIALPTTASGVQATASCTIGVATQSVSSGGTGYTVGDTLTFSGGTFTAAATATVSTVSGGVITAITMTSGGTYTVAPSNPVSVTGGTGTGATFTLGFGVNSTFTITNAGSGYVEQPTVSFSGGGGSGASAYATVGSGTVVRSLGTSMSFYSPNGETFRIGDNGTLGGAYWTAFSASTQSELRASNASAGAAISNAGAFPILFRTSISTEQFRVAHTASAVNYVQVTGSATNGQPNITAQGSDASIGLTYRTKGNFNHQFQNGNAQIGFEVSPTGSGANYISVASAIATASPTLSVKGSDTNIDINLTPKGTGVVSFGTYTASVLSVTGYITIKDSGGTTRRLLVG